MHEVCTVHTIKLWVGVVRVFKRCVCVCSIFDLSIWGDHCPFWRDRYQWGRLKQICWELGTNTKNTNFSFHKLQHETWAIPRITVAAAASYSLQSWMILVVATVTSGRFISKCQLVPLIFWAREKTCSLRERRKASYLWLQERNTSHDR